MKTSDAGIDLIARRCVAEGCVEVPFTQGQFDAAVSFVFTRTAGRSHELLRRTN